eukprot:1051455-Amphidinium_carterae.2
MRGRTDKTFILGGLLACGGVWGSNKQSGRTCTFTGTQPHNVDQSFPPSERPNLNPKRFQKEVLGAVGRVGGTWVLVGPERFQILSVERSWKSQLKSSQRPQKLPECTNKDIPYDSYHVKVYMLLDRRETSSFMACGIDLEAVSASLVLSEVSWNLHDTS